MGLGVTLSNALAGMDVSQKGLEVLSRNVSNAGTAGYHRQSLDVTSLSQGSSDSARVQGINRAFSESLQTHYTNTSSDFGYADTTARFLDRLQTYFGVPGSDGALDTVYGTFQSSLQALATSPDDATVRAQVITGAQALAGTLNGLSGDIQGLRQEAENQIGADVTALNQNFSDLSKINQSLSQSSAADTARASLLDERDRLVSKIASMIDVKATYRPNGAVNLVTRSGIGLMDAGAAPKMTFDAAGSITAKSLLTNGPDNGVGTLTLTTSSGTKIDLVKQHAIQSGELGALVKLRDETLVQAQGQLDEIAAGLATSMSNVDTNGTDVAGGKEVGVGGLAPGNSVSLTYSDGAGASHTIKVVRVDDASKLPMDYTDAQGTEVLGLDFAGGIADLQSKLPAGLTATLSGTGAAQTLQVVTDGSGPTVTSLVSHSTATSAQGGGSALPLFVESDGQPYTGSLDGTTQKLGFARRIAVNNDIARNDKLLVQTDPSVSLGDAARPSDLVDRLQSFTLQTDRGGSPQLGRFQLAGNLQTVVGQTLNFQANSAASAKADQTSQQTALDAISQRQDATYGVNVDEEMARLMELQNAYAAGARVISVVQELMNRLMQA